MPAERISKFVDYHINPIDLSSNYVTTNTVFKLKITLNRMDFKIVSQGLWSEKQNILQHMHKKEFWILTNKCGNNLKHKNEAEEPWLSSHGNPRAGPVRFSQYN